MTVVGIDLGTTNSAVAIMRGRPVLLEDCLGNRTTPSAVGWDEELEELVVGLDAKEGSDIYGTVLSIKRLMGTDVRTRIGPHNWLPEEISAEILKALVKQAEEKTGEKITEAAITVPAHFQMAAMAATKRAGELAGLEVQQLLAEPSAAVMAYGPTDDEKILVYDLGGGTFDVTVIDCFAGMLTTLSVFGNNKLGGDDFDLRLIRRFVELIESEQGIKLDLETDAHASAVLKKAAERAKIEMSRKKGARVTIPKVTESGGTAIGFETLIKTDEFNALIGDLVESTLDEVKKALEHAKLTPKDIDTVLLVGGSTYVPLVQKMVEDYFGKPPNKTVNPDLAVAMGAAHSLVHTPGKKHVVTVRHIPETTPNSDVELEGRTTPGSKLKIEGGSSVVELEADDEGYYDVTVPLNPGLNQLVFTAVSPDGARAKLEPEPIIQDDAAPEVEELPDAPQPRLARAISVQCGMQLDAQITLQDYAKVILPSQTELPATFGSDQFATSVDNQRVLEMAILEGEVPQAALNTRLAKLTLNLPANVPQGETVVVNFTIDESFGLTAELEVPGVNKRGKISVNLQSPAQQLHVYEQIENSLVKWGDRMKPADRASLEQSRITLEDLTTTFGAELDGAAQGNCEASHVAATYGKVMTEGKSLAAQLSKIARENG